MILELFPKNPDQRKIDHTVNILNRGGVVIYPTDTVYSFGCSLYSKKGIEKLARLKDVKVPRSNFSIVFFDLSQLSEFTRQLSRPVFKILNNNLPGPFTFILPAAAKIPKLFDSNRKTIGIRIPDNNIARIIVKTLGHPLVTTSLKDDDEILEYPTDPDLIWATWENKVDLIVLGGPGDNTASTVVDLTGTEPVILREGSGSLRI